ncbi:MAG: hypothetical protein JW937_08325 [Candidatus Omnitrophica bacterium]|nr:hypothetical protein [Candidatus Omnitrophota bacterium]
MKKMTHRQVIFPSGRRKLITKTEVRKDKDTSSRWEKSLFFRVCGSRPLTPEEAREVLGEFSGQSLEWREEALKKARNQSPESHKRQISVTRAQYPEKGVQSLMLRVKGEIEVLFRGRIYDVEYRQVMKVTRIERVSASI